LQELQSQIADMLKHNNQTEARCDSLEMRISQATNSHAERFQRLSERQEQLSQSLETVRLEKQNLEITLQSTANLLKDLEDSISKNNDEARRLVEKEGQTVRDEFVRNQRKIISDRSKQITDLEIKVSDALEKEVVSRETGTKQIYEDLNKAVKQKGDDCAADCLSSATIPVSSIGASVRSSPVAISARVYTAPTPGSTGSVTLPAGSCQLWTSFGQAPKVASLSGSQRGQKMIPAGMMSPHAPISSPRQTLTSCQSPSTPAVMLMRSTSTRVSGALSTAQRSNSADSGRARIHTLG
jgi:hypothetical protein